MVRKAELSKKSIYQQLDYGAPGCPDGLEIPSVDECERAILSLGVIARPAWVSAFPGLPSMCSVRESPTKGSPERMHYNSAKGGMPRSDLAPVCKKPGVQATDASAAEAAHAGGEFAMSGAQEAEEAPPPLPELAGQTQEDLFSGDGWCFIYLREGPITAVEAQMVLTLEEKFRPRLEERGTSLRWMWLDLRAERKLKAVFDMPALPSAVIFDSQGKGDGGGKPRFASLEHKEEDGDPQPADVESMELLLNTFLGGDASFVSLQSKRGLQWAKRVVSS